MSAAPATLEAAAALAAAGRLRDAIDVYARALSADPRQPQGWFALARLLNDCAQFELALTAYAQALAHGYAPAAAVHVNRANILTDALNRHAEAEAELQRALALEPDDPAALLNLGNLHEEHGRAEPAVACYRRLLQTLAPDHPCALDAEARLLELDPPAQAASTRLAALAARAAGAPDGVSRANLHYALGRACDRLGEPAQAVEQWTAANACARRLAPPYRRADTRALIDATIAAFGESAPAAPAAAADGPRAAPLLVCGMFRSGSTLLERVLAAHPAVAAGGELELLRRYVHGPLAPFPASWPQRSAAERQALAAHYRQQIRLRVPGAERVRWVTDKRPDNFLLVGLALALFPDARVIHTRRDPVDTGLSIWMHHLDGRAAGYASDLGDIGHYQAEHERLMAHWHRAFPGRIRTFDYDAFVREPRHTLAPLLEWLGLPWDESCLQFHARPGAVKTASYWQIRRPLHAGASGRWRRYRPWLDPLLDALRDGGVAVAD